ncbi:kynureninase [Nadsonia fulvescens var. elongata DSM 6958]|uniref:Kynureninase n=1 Tax=Nadsonia fulvescens var. elongata DSM 6958 TaxID=857566 RepID=A0A1E3PS07_9ASCO|nr:kynureninase [Nadsonia fulvescens var. elongata DSM 6958]
MSDIGFKHKIKSKTYAEDLDAKFPGFKSEFSIPTIGALGANNTDPNDTRESIYLCGNSLGLMPNSANAAVQAEIDTWSKQGVTGHFRRQDKREPWVTIDNPVSELLAPVVGAADASEVSVMNTLTSNLHTMFAAFYKPTAQRFKILFEKKAFPSDNYALQSQCQMHGLDPNETLILLEPRSGEYTLRTEDILAKIEEEKESLAMVFFSGIQFYTGQFFEIEKITSKGKSVGAIVGWDLAHCTGNVPLELHKWEVDFAVMCTYKYLNAGPGGIGAIFVHKKYANDNRPRLAGWWGNNPFTRFQMLDYFDAIPGAAGYKMSNPSVLNTVCLRASLEIFQKAGGVKALRLRSLSLTNYLYDLLVQSDYYRTIEESNLGSVTPGFTIISPSRPEERGSQLSLLFLPIGKGLMQHVFSKLEQKGVVGDERQPDVIRLAPTALYNDHYEVLEAVDILESSFVSFSD